MTIHLTCLLTDSALAGHYSDGLLNAADRQRLQQSPALAQRLDWRVSRVLKFQTASSVQSLSHSHGHAALLVANAQIPLGVDIEKIKPRDFGALAEWVCTVEEQHYLAASNRQAEAFYRLWCIKEALIKAAALNFPADMPRVGYTFVQNKISGLRVDGENGWHGVSARLGEDFALACVWKYDMQTVFDWQFYGGLQTESLQDEKAV